MGSLNAPSASTIVYTCTAKTNTYLNDCALSGNFEHLALASLAISEYDVDDLSIPIEQKLEIN
jgi:hypothetical protein